MNSGAYLVNIELDLEYGVSVVEELSIESEIHVKPLSHISYVTLLVSDYILLLEYFELSLGRIHVCESLCSLNEAHELDSIGKLWIDLHDQINFSEVALFTFTEKLSLNIYDCLSGRLEVPVNKVVMHLSYWPRHDHIDVSINEIFALEAQNILNFIINMDYSAYFS
jgi:hypothetical protein